MKLFLHRANTHERLTKCLENGWGAEVDVRTHMGDPYLSHDPIKSADGLVDLTELVWYAEHGVEIILDFKESGIIDPFLPWVQARPESWLATDLIVPDQIYAEARGLRTLARNSVHASTEGWCVRERIEGTFHGQWMDYVQDLLAVKEPLEASKNVYLVSSELHGWRLENQFIEAARTYGFAGVCTDYPLRYEAGVKHG